MNLMLMAPDAEKSVFKMKVYFTYPNRHDVTRHAETTMYSYDLPEERNECPGHRVKRLWEYNGYIYLVRQCYKRVCGNELLYARIYANRMPGKHELDYIAPDNIYLKMSRLTVKKT